MDDWRWVVGVSVTLGIAAVGGIWALVHLVAKLVARATAMEIKLELVVPVAQEMPSVRQAVAIHEHRLSKHDEEIDQIREEMIPRAAKRH